MKWNNVSENENSVKGEWKANNIGVINESVIIEEEIQWK